MSNGRCRMHGGASAGPRTREGLARSRRARWKHGFYSVEAKAQRRLTRDLLKGKDLADVSPFQPAPSARFMSRVCGLDPSDRNLGMSIRSAWPQTRHR